MKKLKVKRKKLKVATPPVQPPKPVEKPTPTPAPEPEPPKLSKSKRIARAQQSVNWQLADRLTKNMRHIDLKRACIARGMPFEELGTHTVLSLHSWFAQNLDRGQNLQLLNEYDAWFKAEMIKRGYPDDDPLFHHTLMLGYNPEAKEDEPKKKIRLKGLKKPEKLKAERIEGTKVIRGTKKAMTYELAKQGLSLDEVTEKVLEAFEDAKESSISIWYRRALKEVKK